MNNNRSVYKSFGIDETNKQTATEDRRKHTMVGAYSTVVVMYCINFKGCNVSNTVIHTGGRISQAVNQLINEIFTCGRVQYAHYGQCVVLLSRD